MSRHNTIVDALIARLQTITVANGYSRDVLEVKRAIAPDWRNAPADHLWVVREAVEGIITQQAGYSSAVLVIDVLCMAEAPGDAAAGSASIASFAEDVCNVVMADTKLGGAIPGGVMRPVSVATSREFSERTGRAAAIVTFNCPYRIAP